MDPGISLVGAPVSQGEKGTSPAGIDQGSMASGSGKVRVPRGMESPGLGAFGISPGAAFPQPPTSSRSLGQGGKAASSGSVTRYAGPSEVTKGNSNPRVLAGGLGSTDSQWLAVALP